MGDFNFRLLSEPTEVFVLDFNQAARSGVSEEAHENHGVRVAADGTCHAIVFWYCLSDTSTPDQEAHTRLVDHAPDVTNSRQMLQTLAHSMTLKCSDEVILNCHRDSEGFHFSIGPASDTPKDALSPSRTVTNVVPADAGGDGDVYCDDDDGDCDGEGQAQRWHFAMLNDKDRNDSYERAIAAAVKKVRARDGDDAVVLDIGAGSGLLAMMAARAGATNVVSCEKVPAMASVATSIVARNGLSHAISVIPQLSNTLSIGEDTPLHRPASLVISEILDCGLLGEGVIPALRHAANKLAAPDAVFVPSAATVVAQLVHLPPQAVPISTHMGNSNGGTGVPISTHMGNSNGGTAVPISTHMGNSNGGTGVPISTHMGNSNGGTGVPISTHMGNSNGGTGVLGFDMQEFDVNRTPVYEQLRIACTKHTMVSEPFDVFSYDLGHPKSVPACRKVLIDVPVLAPNDGDAVDCASVTVTAVVFWFRLTLFEPEDCASSDEDTVTIETCPQNESTCWKQAIQTLKLPVVVPKGHSLRLQAKQEPTKLSFKVKEVDRRIEAEETAGL